MKDVLVENMSTTVVFVIQSRYGAENGSDGASLGAGERGMPC